MDRWDDIEAAIESLQRQTRKADEIILAVDNNDMLFEAASAAFEPSVRVVHNRGERGVSPTRNVAARAAESIVLAYLDDDAVADVAWLEALVGWYSDPEVVGVGGLAFPEWAGDGRPAWFPPSFDWVVGCSHSGVPRTAQPVRNFIGCNMSVRRETWDSIGGFDEGVGRVGSNGGGGDETDFCLRIAEHVGGVIMHEPAGLVRHHVPASRQSVRYFITRCYREGTSKAAIAGRATGGATLGDERAHLLGTLPQEFLSGLRSAATGDVGGLARSSAMVAGTAATIVGFVVGRSPWTRSPSSAVRTVTSPTAFVPAEITQVDIATSRELPVPSEGMRTFALVRSGAQVLGVLDEAAQAVDSGPSLLELGVFPRPQAARGTRSLAVVIATRDRPASLLRTLDSLRAGLVLPDQVVVVDSAPSTNETELALEAWTTANDWPVTYVRSARPGLAVAHNLALDHTDHDIIAMTDDDVLVDQYWLSELVRCFEEHADAACVTGGIMPAELDTWPQQWAEDASRFNKGFSTRVFDAELHRPADDPMFPYTAGTMGSGANMAFTRSWLDANGGFREELGAGSLALGGDDLRAFYDVIRSGHQLVFHPHAIVHHHHHRTEDAIARQSHGYGAGLTAFLASVVHDDPSTLLDMVRLAPRAIGRAREATTPASGRVFPGQAKRASLHRRGMLSGPIRYVRSRRAQP